jgi:uncharacterized protein YeaO (DUF488 family)
MGIKTRRWNDPIEPGDGYRVLVCRYRPRGVRKSDETWNTWLRELGPSAELLADYHGKRDKPVSWSEYRRRYLVEMRGQAEKVHELAQRVRAGQNVTLLCSSACTDAERCHRTLLRDLIEVGAARMK